MNPSLRRARLTFFIGCLLAASVLLPLWRPIGAGLILGYFSEGAVELLARRLRLGQRGRMVAAAAIVAALLLVFLVPIGVGIYQAGRELLQALRDSAGDLALGAGPLGDSIWRWLSLRLERLHLSLSASMVAELGPRLRQAGMAALVALLGWLRGLLSTTPRALFDVVITVTAWWVTAIDGRSQRERILRWLLPWPGPRALLSQAVAEVLRGLIVANVIVAAIQAAICAASLAVFRLPHVFSLGVLSFFLAFVPVIGTAAVTVGAAAYLFSVGRIGAGLAMLVVAVVAGTIDNLLRPFFLRGRLDLPVPWIFLSIMGGVAGFGVAGIVLGPIALSICSAALRALEAEAEEPEPSSAAQ